MAVATATAVAATATAVATTATETAVATVVATIECRMEGTPRRTILIYPRSRHAHTIFVQMRD